MLYKKPAISATEICQNYSRLIYKTAFRIVADALTAEDVTQDIVFKIFQMTSNQKTAIQNWPGYLVRITSRQAIDHLRKQKTRDQHCLQAFNAEQSPTNPGPEQALALDQDVNFIRQALTQLTEQESDVVILKYLQELSYQEIADQLNISNSLVGVTLHRAIKKLTQLIKQTNFSGANHEPA